jgi:hypothetical protein
LVAFIWCLDKLIWLLGNFLSSGSIISFKHIRNKGTRFWSLIFGLRLSQKFSIVLWNNFYKLFLLLLLNLFL